VTVEDAIAHLTEAKAAEVRGHLLGALLVRPGMLDFFIGYEGNRDDPSRVAEAAASAGFALDEIDTALLVMALGRRPGVIDRSVAPRRFIEASNAVNRWREATIDERLDVLGELLEVPAVMTFVRGYVGDLEPARVTEAAHQEGLDLSDMEALVVAVLAGWSPT
jgi:hypothetical protein